MIPDSRKIWLYRLWHGTEGHPSKVRRIVIISAFVFLGILAVVFTKYGRGWWRTIRAAKAVRMIPTAQEFERKGDHNQALKTIDQAYADAPNDQSIVREYARLCSLYGLENGLYLYQRLRSEGVLTLEDQINETELQLLLNKLPEAVRNCEAMIVADPGNMAVVNLFARASAGQRQYEAAAHYYRQSLEFAIQSGDPRKLWPTAAFFLGQKGKENPSAEAMSRLALAIVKACENLPPNINPEIKSQGYMMAASIQPMLPETRERMEAVVWNPGILPSNDRFSILSVISSPESHRRLRRMLDEFSELSVNDQALVCCWLSSQADYFQILRVLDPDKAMRHEDMFQSYLMALLDRGRTEEAKQLIERPQLPIKQSTAELLRALMKIDEGADDFTKEEYIRSALRQSRSENNVRDMLVILSVALNNDLRAMFSQAINSLLEEPALAGEVLAMWSTHIRKNHESALEVLDKTTIAMRANSSNPDISTNHYYLCLLTGESMEKAVEGTRQLELSAGATPEILWLAAYSKYRQHISLDSIIDSLPLDLASMSPPMRLVAMLMLTHEGRTEKARHILPWMRSDNLFKEELDLLNSITATLNEPLPPAAPAPQ